MLAADLSIRASYISDNEDWISAIATVLVAFVIAFVVDRLVFRHGTRVASKAGATVSQVAATRLRFLRRLVYAGILVLGLLVALAQLPALNTLAATLFASGALAAAVVGFAARPVLGNAIAGLLLAITQPLRLGDRVVYGEHEGNVEDIRLTLTYLRTGDDRRIVIPNELLVQGVLVNETIVTPLTGVEAEVWLPLEADADRALAALAPEVAEVRVAELSSDAVKLVATRDPVEADRKGAEESALRAACLRRLREAGMFGAAQEPPEAAERLN